MCSDALDGKYGGNPDYCIDRDDGDGRQMTICHRRECLLDDPAPLSCWCYKWLTALGLWVKTPLPSTGCTTVLYLKLM